MAPITAIIIASASVLLGALMLCTGAGRRFSMFWVWRVMSARADKGLRTFKTELLATVTGRVLEIGAGLGTNVPYLQSADTLFVLEQNEHMIPKLRAAMQDRVRGGKGDVLAANAENVPLPSSSVDCVVCILVLCSVSSPLKVLQEAQRVLRPGGRFFFAEHVAARPDGSLSAWVQKMLTWTVWPLIGDGCHLTRHTAETIERMNGWKSVDIRRVDLPTLPPFLAPHIIGVATKV